VAAMTEAAFVAWRVGGRAFGKQHIARQLDRTLCGATPPRFATWTSSGVRNEDICKTCLEVLQQESVATPEGT